MEVRILGAHHCESETAKMVSLLVDEVLAIDAGSLTSSLSLPQQEKITSIILSHYHYDHIRDIPTIALNNYAARTIKVYGTAPILDLLCSHLLDGAIYPNFTERPSPKSPTLKLFALEPYKEENIDGYKVLALPVYHTVPTVGFQITSPQGKSLFYTSDTTAGFSTCWDHISPQLLIVNLTLSNRFEDIAIESGHLTPQMLKGELIQFRQIKHYLPPVVLIHMSLDLEEEIREEITQLATELEAEITLGYEGMMITV